MNIISIDSSSNIQMLLSDIKRRLYERKKMKSSLKVIKNRPKKIINSYNIIHKIIYQYLIMIFNVR